MPPPSSDPATLTSTSADIERRDFVQWRLAAIAMSGLSGVGLFVIAAAPVSSGHDRVVWAVAGAVALVVMVSVAMSSRQPANRNVWVASLAAIFTIGGLTAASSHTAGFPYFLLIAVLSGAYLLPARQSVAMSLVAIAGLGVALSLRPAGFDVLLFLQVTMVNSFGTVLTRSLRRGRDALIDDLARTAAIDALTGIANRGTYEEVAARLVDRARIDGTPLSLVMFDIDHFKAVNDRQGHAAGDRALRGFAVTLTDHSRPTDLVARMGGEEFVAVMPGAAASEAAAFAERVGAALRSGHVSAEGRLTVSAGVSALGFEHDDADMLLREADRALYAAKAGGRDRVVLADELDRRASFADTPSALREVARTPTDR